MKENIPSFFSAKYNDIYFTPDDPESEKQFVFIEANRLAERIKRAETFTVAELGFGFGLNCALTLHAAAKADCLHKLQFFSVEENFPPQNEVKALADKLKICREEYVDLWAAEAEILRIAPSPPSPLSRGERGSINFPLPPGEGSRVRVHQGHVLSFLNTSDFVADCWYFDGFSPAKNPDMWSAEVFVRAFALTRPGGTFSTYTSAGWVRRNLTAAGFVVNRVSGFGSKREMLVGMKPVVSASAVLNVNSVETPVPRRGLASLPFGSSPKGRIEV